MINYITALAKNTILKTDRLILRPVTLEDTKDMYEFASDEENTYFVYERHRSIEDTENNIADFFMGSPLGKYGVELKTNRKLIGNIDIRINKEHHSAEIGYVLNKKFHKQGYMTEAAKEILRLGFKELKLHKIYATCDERNNASSNVMQRMNMSYEGTSRHAKRWKNGEWVNEEYYSILNTDYFQRK